MSKILSSQAQIDLEEIFVYIARQSDVSIADQLIDAVVGVCELLGDYPEMGRRRPEYDNFGLEVRSIAKGSYLILYTVTKSSVVIIRVVHGARDIDSSDVYPLPDVSAK